MSQKKQGIVEKLFALNQEKTVYNECIDHFTIYEYNDLFRQNDLSDFDHGRFLVLRAIMNMIQFDPKYGRKKKNMSEEDNDTWEDIDHDLIQGGSILYNINGYESMYDIKLWGHIPKELEKYIRLVWKKIK